MKREILEQYQEQKIKIIKSDKDKVKEELLNKEKILDLRLSTIGKQELSLMEKLTSLREEVMKQPKK